MSAAQWGGTKTDWKIPDGVTNAHFNRIEENIQHLKNACTVYRDPGTYKFIVPLNVFLVFVTIVGAGGSGGGPDVGQNYSGGGGGGGAIVLRAPYSVQPGQEISIVVGAGGTADQTKVGTDGGNSAVGILSVEGGKGGGLGNSSTASGGRGGINPLLYDWNGRDGGNGTTNGAGGRGGGNIWFEGNSTLSIIPGVGGKGGDYSGGNPMPGAGGNGLVIIEY